MVFNRYQACKSKDAEVLPIVPVFSAGKRLLVYFCLGRGAGSTCSQE